MNQTELTVLCAMRHLARPAKLAEIAALCVVVNPPSVYGMPLETARGAVKALEKRGLVSRPKPALYGVSDPDAVLHPSLVWTVDEPRAMVARSGFVVEGAGADRRVSHVGLRLDTAALDLSADGGEVSSDLSYHLWAAVRERGAAAYRPALAAVLRTAAVQRVAVELDDSPQFTCGHCGAVVRPRVKHCGGAREGSRPEDMPPCRLVARSPVELGLAPGSAPGPSGAPALDAAFTRFDRLAQSVKEAR